MKIEEKEVKLINMLENMEHVIVAFSGGVDSTYLAAISHQVLGEKSLAITLQTEYVPKREVKEAKELAETLGINHQIVQINTLGNQKIASNPVDRCFFCKTDLFSHMVQTATKLGIKYVLDGSNTDDLKEYRPGLKALRNLKILSPLKDADMSKEDIRLLSKKMNLPTWDKSSFSCLATRIPYDNQITVKKLVQIDKAEDYLYQHGFKQFRVRHHDTIARIEVLPEDFGRIVENHENILTYFKSLGFNYVTLDLQGYKSGSLNEILKKAEKL